LENKCKTASLKKVKRSLSSDYHVWRNLHDGLFMVTAGLAATYGIATFGPTPSLQNKIKAMKSKMKELILAHNNQIVS
jgi:hypothetical protein